MDVINEQAITDKVVNPALDRLLGQVLPAFQGALEKELDALHADVSEVLHVALVGAESMLSTANRDLAAVIDRLNGSSLTIGPITIPAFSVLLSIPKSQTVV